LRGSVTASELPCAWRRLGGQVEPVDERTVTQLRTIDLLLDTDTDTDTGSGRHSWIARRKIEQCLTA